MAENTLEIAYLNGQIIDASHINELTQALIETVVGRDSTGTPFPGQNLGTALIPWGTLFLAEQSIVKSLGDFIQAIATDAVTTGTDADLPHPGKSIVRLTNTSLVSIDSITNTTAGRGLIIINDTTVEITIKNNSAINTGTGSDLIVSAGACVWLIYEPASAQHRIIGGSGGGGASQKNYNLTNNQTITDVAGLLLDSTKETSAEYLFEIERIGATTYRQIIKAFALYDGTSWNLFLGNYAGSEIVQSSINNTYEIVLIITTGGQFRYASGNLSSHTKSTLKVIKQGIRA